MLFVYVFISDSCSAAHAVRAAPPLLTSFLDRLIHTSLDSVYLCDDACFVETDSLEAVIWSISVSVLVGDAVVAESRALYRRGKWGVRARSAQREGRAYG